MGDPCGVLRTFPHRYAALLAAVVLAQLLDLLTFVPAVARVGIGAESNPLAQVLYLSAGPLGPALLKVGAITLMLLAMLRVERRFPRYALPSAALLVAIGLAGASSNLVNGLVH
jgi:hypothetical protein